MEDIDYKFLKYIYDDLIYLLNNLSSTVGDDEIRRSSAILRSFLVDGKLQVAWKMLGFEKQPKVYASYLDVNSVKKYAPSFIQAGGAQTFGVYISNACIFSRVLSEEEMKGMKSELQPQKKAFYLSEYLESFCIGHGNWLLSRKDVIEYVANKLGGVHYDKKRNRNNDQCYEALDKLPDNLKVGMRNPVMYELLSTSFYLVALR